MAFDRIKNILRASIEEQLEKIHDKLNDFDGFQSNEGINHQNFEEINREYERLKNEDRKNTQQNRYRNPLNDKEAGYYQDLELPVGTSFEKIKKQYRSLMKIYHPDLFPNDQEKQDLARQISQKINEAYRYFEEQERG